MPLLLLAALLHAAPLTTGVPVALPGAVADTTSSAGNVTVVRAPDPGFGIMVDSIVVEKHAHRLSLYYAGKRVRQYLVALGNPRGDKLSAGDRRTPEGKFWVDYRNPASKYYLALHIAYPDSAHVARAQARSVEPGGDIMIHGLPNGMRAAGASHRKNDWTNGCVALTDEEMDEIWRSVDVGTPVEIRP